MALGNSLGRKIQLTNSPVYSELRDKIDWDFNLNYEDLLSSIGNLSFSLAKSVGADAQKAKFYASVYGTGCINGGKKVFDYINSCIPNNISKLSQEDVMFYNMKKVFPNMEQEFDSRELEEMSQLFDGVCTTKETQVTRIIFILKLISQKYISMGKLDNTSSVDFIFGELKKIVENYTSTGVLGIPSNLYNEFYILYNSKLEISDEEKSKIDPVVANYISSLNKNSFIEGLNAIKTSKKVNVK